MTGGADQSEHALLHQVAEREPVPLVLAGHRDHEPQVAFDQVASRAFAVIDEAGKSFTFGVVHRFVGIQECRRRAASFHPLGEVHFILLIEQVVVGDLA